MFKKYILISLFLAQGFCLFATRQVPDIILYNGKEYALNVNPMETYFKQFPEKRPPFRRTSLWRGYVATFEIIQNKLWVINIEKPESQIIDGEYTSWYVSIIRECLDGKDRMEIGWFNGLLVLPQGKLVKYIHMGYASTYEYYTLLEIENGIFQRELNMNYMEYIEFREKQFEHYKQTEEYKKLFNKMNNENMSDDEIEYFLKIYIIEYLDKILE